MAKIRIINSTSVPVSTWEDFSLPFPLASHDQGIVVKEIGGGQRMFPGVKGADNFYSVRLDDLEPNANFLAEVLPEPYTTPYQLSDWVSDDISDLMPTVEIHRNDSIVTVIPTQSRTLIDHLGLKIYELEGMAGGYKLKIWYNLYAKQDLVPIQFCVSWSDRSDPSWFKEFDKITITFNEELFIDFATRLGVTLATSPTVEGKYVSTLVNSYTNVGDGQRLDFYGALFCRPKWMSVQALRDTLTHAQIEQFLNQNQDRFDNFQSRKQFPVSVMSTEWNGNLGPSRTYFTPHGTEQSEINTRIASHIGQMNTPGTYFNLRFYANTPNTGGTGDQVVFGAGKDSPSVITGDGRFIHALRYHHTYPLRPFHWHELDGAALKAAMHPNCTTWNMIPDHRLGSDMLGKPRNWAPESSRFAGGYGGADEQHRQQLYETFAMTMAREPLLRDSARAALEADLLAPRNRMGAARGVGRCVDTWLEIAHVNPELRATALFLAQEKVQATKSQWEGKNVPGPIKPLTIVEANGRGLVNYDYWVPWEQSLFAIGAYKYLHVQADTVFRQALLDVVRSVVEYGFIWDAANNRYLTITCARWIPDGSRVVITDVHGQIGTGSDKEFRTDSNLTVWTLPALQVYLNLTDSADHADTVEGSTDPLRVKAKDVIRKILPNGPTKSRDSEWLSLRRV